MNSTTGKLFASLVISAACLGGGLAEAAPTPSHEWGSGAGRERHERFEMQNVLPEWARANDNGPALANGYGYGYYSRSLRDFEKRGDKVHKEKDLNEKKPKKDKNGNEEPGSSQGPKEKPDKPETPRGNGQGNDVPDEEPPILPEPIGYPNLPPSELPGGEIPGGEIPEPSSATLLGIAMVGWLTSAASRRPR